MSWFFGAIGDISESDKHRFAGITSRNNLLTHTSERFLIAAGGIRETCSYQLVDAESGFVICGKGISAETNPIHFLTVDEWKLIVSNNKPTSNLDGHFAGIHWKAGQCTFFTDSLGLREILLYENKGVLYFATSEEYLAALSGHSLEIDWSTFSTRWLLATQLSLDSITQNTSRLTNGATAVFDGSLKIIPGTDTLEENIDSSNTIEEELLSLIEIVKCVDKPLHLTLSGGMDSRLLLSFLLTGKPCTFDAYTFGQPTHPDVLIAKEIAKDFNISFHTRTFEFPSDTYQLVDRVRAHCIAKKAVTSLSSYIEQSHYEREELKDGIIVDGGFGEIGRRRIFERQRVRNAQEVSSGDPNLIFAVLQRHRSDIFKNGFNNQLALHACNDIAEYIAKAPPINEIGVDKWLDILSVRTMLPNYIGIEQSRTDRHVLNYSPFVQKRFIAKMLAAPIEVRKNGRLYRDIIRKRSPRLATYPLARFDSSYPFRFGALESYLWTKAKKLFSNISSFSGRNILLLALESFIRDTASSQAVREFVPYDQVKIRTMIDKFYAGHAEYAPEIDWWMSFELWRQSLA
jgi:hypothetical protein